MPVKHKRARIEIARAVHRLTTEVLMSLKDLALAEGKGADTLKRWAIAGKRGIYLDAVHRPGVGWMSSVEAVSRFRTECATKGLSVS